MVAQGDELVASLGSEGDLGDVTGTSAAYHEMREDGVGIHLEHAVVVQKGSVDPAVVSGAVGVWLHYRGNVEFELEMYPSMQGIELVQKTLTGATPVLAPGSMTLLGLIGLTHSYRHPCIHGGADALRNEEGDS